MGNSIISRYSKRHHLTPSKKNLKMFVRAIFVFLFIGVIVAEKCVDDSGCTCCDKHFEAYEDESCGKLCEDLAPEVCILCPDFAEDVCNRCEEFGEGALGSDGFTINKKSCNTRCNTGKSVCKQRGCTRRKPRVCNAICSNA